MWNTRLHSGSILCFASMVAGCAAAPSNARRAEDPDNTALETATRPVVRKAEPKLTGPCSSTVDWIANAEQFEVINQREESIRLLKRCLGSVGGPVSAWRFLASMEIERGEVEQARRTLLRTVARHPEDALSWLTLGRLEAQRNEGALAIGAYERAARLVPTNEAVQRERARVKARFGSAVSMGEVRSGPLLVEARERLELGDTEGALATLAAAQALVHQDKLQSARIEHQRALIHVSLGQRAMAATAVKKGLKLLGSGRYPVRLRADLHVVAAELALADAAVARAVAAAERALDLVPAHPFAAVNHGLAVLQLGDKTTAIKDLSLAIRSGLTKRLAKTDFEKLPGVANLLSSNASFREQVNDAWSQSN